MCWVTGISSKMKCAGSSLASFSTIIQSYWLRRCLVATGSSMLPHYGITFQKLYTNPVIFYYHENLCANQGVASTCNTQAVNGSTHASISKTLYSVFICK